LQGFPAAAAQQKVVEVAPVPAEPDVFEVVEDCPEVIDCDISGWLAAFEDEVIECDIDDSSRSFFIGTPAASEFVEEDVANAPIILECGRHGEQEVYSVGRQKVEDPGAGNVVSTVWGQSCSKLQLILEGALACRAFCALGLVIQLLCLGCSLFFLVAQVFTDSVGYLSQSRAMRCLFGSVLLFSVAEVDARSLMMQDGVGSCVVISVGEAETYSEWDGSS
jgi:hypothetical protein